MPSVIDTYILRVTDLDRSITFWEQAMGAALVTRTEGDRSSDAVLRSAIGGGSVHLTQVHDDPSSVDLGHSIFRQYMLTSDSPRLYERATTLGYEATHDPFDVPGRVNVVKSYTRDPDGYLMDLCEYQGELLHGQINPKDHVSPGGIATYIGQIAMYVTSLDPAIHFWKLLGIEVLDRVSFDGYMELALIRGDGGTVIQLMHVTGGRERPERTNAVMPQPGAIDLGSGIQGFHVVVDDCQGLYDRAVAAGHRSAQVPVEDSSAITAALLDPDGYRVEMSQTLA